MPQECTALAIIWPADDERYESRYELWENFRPVWHWTGAPPAKALVSALDYPLATLVALHLARAGQLEKVPGLRLPATTRKPLMLCRARAHQLYRVLEGRAVSIVRYDRSYVSDRELACLRQAGVQLDLLSDWTRAGEAR